MKRRSGFGWLELATGALLIALGIWAFTDPGQALSSMAFVYGIAAVILGVVDILMYIRLDRYTGFGPVVSLISGILSVMSGMVLLVYPDAAAIALTLFFPLWFMAHCISKLTQLNFVRYTAGNGMYYFSLIVNVIGLVLGFMMFLKPLFALDVIRYFACAYLLLLGVDSVITAFSRMGTRD